MTVDVGSVCSAWLHLDDGMPHGMVPEATEPAREGRFLSGCDCLLLHQQGTKVASAAGATSRTSREWVRRLVITELLCRIVLTLVEGCLLWAPSAACVNGKSTKGRGSARVHEAQRLLSTGWTNQLAEREWHWQWQWQWQWQWRTIPPPRCPEVPRLDETASLSRALDLREGGLWSSCHESNGYGSSLLTGTWKNIDCSAFHLVVLELMIVVRPALRWPTHLHHGHNVYLGYIAVRADV